MDLDWAARLQVVGKGLQVNSLGLGLRRDHFALFCLKVWLCGILGHVRARWICARPRSRPSWLVVFSHACSSVPVRDVAAQAHRPFQPGTGA